MEAKTANIVQKSKIAFANAQSNHEVIRQSFEECTKAKRELQQKLRRARTIGEKQKIICALGIVKGYCVHLKFLQRTTGAGLSQIKDRTNWASIRTKWVDIESAFTGRVRTGFIVNLSHKDPRNFLEDCAVVFQRHIKKSLREEMALKVNTIFCGEFRIIKTDVEVFEEKFMNTKSVPIFRETDLKIWFKVNVQDVILKKLEEFQERDSGWALSSIVNLAVNINKFTPQLGSSYIPLPKQIETKKACVNVKNDDDACFAWAIVSSLYPTKNHSDRISSYPYYKRKLSLTGIQFPMTVRQIPRFEKQNDISVNLYILKMNKKKFVVLPTFLTKDKKEQHVNLLMIQNVYFDENNDDNNDDDDDLEQETIRYHYVWIKNLSRLLSSQLSRCNGAKFFCDRCLHYYSSALKLKAHAENCGKVNNCRIKMPSVEDENNILRFKNFKNKLWAPFVIYADLECFLLKPTPLENATSRKKKTSAKEYRKHIPHSAAYYVKCTYDPTLSFYESYRGADCIEWLVGELESFAGATEALLLNPLPMNPLSIVQNIEFESASTCYICEKPFTPEDVKVHDHCHLTGNYRGPAHKGCNLNFQDTHTIPIIFHNLSGYDSHFIIKNIARDLKGRVDLLPINKERYISFTKRLDEYVIKFRFIDSFKFMSSSLDALVSTLTKFPILKSEFVDLSESQFNLITRKGVFPYDYCDDEHKFLETSLPDISQFYNKLNDTNIKDEQYAHAQKVWTELNISNFGEYSDLYLKTDVLLLADVFEKFRSSCNITYGLDPAHYFTLPGYTWDAMLKYTNIPLELITDVDMLMFIERGIRGGLSQCSKRYSKANNKYMSDYNVTEPSKYLMYFDVNNQYGWGMSQPLPYNGFSWLEDIQNFKVDNILDDSDIGYILEVDLEYPSDLHDQHKDLPFCPEHVVPPGAKQKKLMATLNSKTKYIIHYPSLKQAMRYGLKLTKIHKILQFNQACWLKPYIDLNTSLRTAATSKFEKDLYKLINNAVFGKTMENIRKHSIVKLVTKWAGRFGAEAYISKPEFKASSIFDEQLIAIELNKTEIFFNKPIYVGMCILDLAKTTMYDFHYGYMVPEFGANCTVCYTDTDSLIYEVTCPDLYQIIKRDAVKYFDTSDYPAQNPFNIPNTFNKKVLGMMKDENEGKVMREFVGLRSKMYATRVAGVKPKDEARSRRVLKNM